MTIVMFYLVDIQKREIFHSKIAQNDHVSHKNILIFEQIAIAGSVSLSTML